MTDDVKRITMFHPVRMDRESNPPMWYLWPLACPMIADKIAAGEPAPMACQGGHVEKLTGNLRLFTCCWHSDLGRITNIDGERYVACHYNRETDDWNRPMGKVDPNWYQPFEIGDTPQ